jgi:hypothetical protein
VTKSFLTVAIMTLVTVAATTDTVLGAGWALSLRVALKIALDIAVMGLTGIGK